MFKVDFGQLVVGFRLFDGGLGLQHVGIGLVQFGFGSEFLLVEGFLPLIFFFQLGEASFGLVEFGLAQVDGGDVFLLFDHKQNVAFFDRGTFVKQHFFQITADLRLDVYFVDGFHMADEFLGGRHVFQLCFFHQYERIAAGARRAPSSHGG